MLDYCHLHNHTQYSLLDGANDIGAMMDKAVSDGQTAIALTDHGNMFGAFKFVAEANKRNIKPIVGCEFYLVEDRFQKAFGKAAGGKKDVRYHQLMLAKNAKGYRNLSMMCSLGFQEGLYGKHPRIDKTLIEKHHEGIIATSCCLGAEIPQLIIQGKLDKAESVLKWWLDIFGEDYYIELQRHRGLENIDGLGISQEDVNQTLIKLAQKYNVKVIATNDSHYLNEEDAELHDILLSINTGSKISDEKRFKFASSDFFFKTKAEMNTLFGDVKEAIDNTMEIASKVETLSLARDVILPEFPIPQQFNSQDDYLKHLSFLGAQKRYGTITKEIEERINFELEVIANSGYPGYFLIVQDFTTTAREMGVSVGPGRGSAAGSVVAYCLGITNIDPIKYDLLFERFLNPERISMPDIDIDFDDEGRAKVIDYVVQKYGENQVAQIITYGTMAAKMSLRDVGRVTEVPLAEVDTLSKAFPSHLSASLNKILKEDGIDSGLKDSMNSEDIEKANKFRDYAKQDTKIGELIRKARALEGSIRNTGIHACGMIITPEDIRNFIPVAKAKGSDLLISQFDNNVVEDAGLLKMDFLGLKTLTIIKDAVKMVNDIHKVDLDIDEIPLDDPETYEIFQKGETIGIFQYESPGMQKHLKDLIPDKFEDLIAMNALFRPGPLQYIPNFIARKNGKEAITYDIPEMKEYLEDTYGITVYQEQVMLLSQKLGGFSKGQADMLRKAMGKKKRKLIDQMYPQFVEGCKANGYDEKVVNKVWKDWEAFASYAFNKSHSTCYAYLAFQTAYLKRHYPAEFMASVLNHNRSSIDSLNKYLRECKRMKVEVLGPDVNESQASFYVNVKGKVRFGLVAIKGVGEGPVSNLLEERKKGPFSNIFDLTKRISLNKVNKKSLESLAYSGALDSFGISRRSYFEPLEKSSTVIEYAVKFGNLYQQESANAQATLFGDAMESMVVEPELENVPEWPLIMKLNNEKKVNGIYISGHPLDDYKLELDNFMSCSLDVAHKYKDRQLKLAGIVTDAFHGINKKGVGYGRFTIQDYDGFLDFSLYQENYQKFKEIASINHVVCVEGRFATTRYNDKVYFKVTQIKLLSSIGKSQVTKIRITIPLVELNEVLLENLDVLFERHKGKMPVNVEVIDYDDQIKLELAAPDRKLEINNDLILDLESLGLDYRLN